MKLCELQEGDLVPGDSGAEPSQLPSWMDFDKFNRGRQFFKDHFISILLAMYCSLVSGLSIINLLEPLVYTGRSDTPAKSIKRYFSTFRHVVLWHLGDVWDTSTTAHRSLLAVRQMHSAVAQQINRDRHRPNKVLVSQYEMALVQCGFMGSVVMYPEQFGIKCTIADLDDYIFFWRGIGYLLGIDDKYNLCRGTFKETHAICKEIENQIVKPSLNKPPQEFEKMAHAFVEGSNIPVKFTLFSYESIMNWIIQMFECEVAMTTPRMSFLDHLRLMFYKTLTGMIRWCPLFERLMNGWFVMKWVGFLKLKES